MQRCECFERKNKRVSFILSCNIPKACWNWKVCFVLFLHHTEKFKGERGLKWRFDYARCVHVRTLTRCNEVAESARVHESYRVVNGIYDLDSRHGRGTWRVWLTDFRRWRGGGESQRDEVGGYSRCKFQPQRRRQRCRRRGRWGIRTSHVPRARTRLFATLTTFLLFGCRRTFAESTTTTRASMTPRNSQSHHNTDSKFMIEKR